MNIKKDDVSIKFLVFLLIWIIGGILLMIIVFVDLMFLGGINRLYNGLAEIISLTINYIEEDILFFSLLLWSIVTSGFLIWDEIE